LVAEARSLLLGAIDQNFKLRRKGSTGQLETFDPHPESDIVAGTAAICTALKEVPLAAVWKRGTHALKTGSLTAPFWPALRHECAHSLLCIAAEGIFCHHFCSALVGAGFIQSQLVVKRLFAYANRQGT
jgi:hypothetical protein